MGPQEFHKQFGEFGQDRISGLDRGVALDVADGIAGDSLTTGHIKAALDGSETLAEFLAKVNHPNFEELFFDRITQLARCARILADGAA